MSRLLKTLNFVRHSRIQIYNLASQSNLRHVANLRYATVQPRRILSSSTSLWIEAQPQPVASHNNLFRNRKALEIDQTFKKLDQEVRRTGRIKRSDIETLFAEIKEAGSTGLQNLLLIRCCGSYLPTVKPESRTALVNEIWNTFKANGSELDVSHYNALLGIYLQNQHKFSPSEFLAEMEKNDVKPDRVTFQHFITRYCQEGDLENASKILEHMKEQNMGVTEIILNSLITGHSRANDMESAKGILDVMRSRDVEPTGLSYTSLLCGYAEKGDIEAIRETLKEAESKEVYLSNKNVLDVIFALASSQNEKHIDEILEKLIKNPGLIQDSTNMMIELLNAGHDDTAKKLLVRLNQLYPDTPLSGLGRLLILHMVTIKRPLSEILELNKLMQEHEICKWSLHHAIDAAYTLHNFDLAKALLQELPKEGHPLRNHYFWPLLAQDINKENHQGVLNTLGLMAQLNCPVNYETWREYVIPFLDGISDNLDELLGKLEGAGLLTTLAANAVLHHLIKLGKLDKAIEFLDHPLFPRRLTSLTQLVGVLNFALNAGAKDNIPVLAELISRLAAHPLSASQQNTDWVGALLLDVIGTTRGLDNSSLILQELAKKDLKLSPQAKFQIKEKLNQIKPESVKDLELLGSQEIEAERETRVSERMFMPLSEEALEKQLAELKASGKDTQDCIYRLLVACARARNTKRLEELREEVGDHLPAPVLAAMIEAYVQAHDLSTAKELFDQLSTQYPAFQLDGHKILNLAKLMIEKEEIKEAFSLIETMSKYVKSERLAFERPENNVATLLSAIADKGLVAETKQMFDFFITEYKLFEPSIRILSPLVQVHLTRDDLDEAYKTFLKCVDDFQILPKKSILMKRFIEKEDMGRLQEMVDVSTKYYGEAFTLHELALSFLELGSTTKARKVFETPGLRALTRFLERRSKFYAEQGKVELMEKLIEVTHNLFDVNTGRLYYHLAQAAAVANDPERALNAWTSMQEQNITPDSETLNLLATVLENNGYAVPFKRPPILPSPPPNQTRTQTLQDTRNQKRFFSKSLLETLIDENKLQDAVNLFKEQLQDKKPLNQHLTRYLFSKLSQSGQCETLEELISSINEPSLLSEVKAYSYLGIAFLSSGRHLEYLNRLEANVDELPSYVFFDKLLEDNPSLEQKVVAYGAARNERGHSDINNVLWSHYMKRGQYTQAQQVLDATPALKENLGLNQVMQSAITFNNVELSSKLVQMLPNLSLNDQKKARVYNVHLLNLIKANKLEEALNLYQEARTGQDLKLHDLTLQKLKKSLEQVQKEVPDQLLKDLEQDSSESSDSSSDDEEPDVIKSK